VLTQEILKVHLHTRTDRGEELVRGKTEEEQWVEKRVEGTKKKGLEEQRDCKSRGRHSEKR